MGQMINKAGISRSITLFVAPSVWQKQGSHKTGNHMTVQQFNTLCRHERLRDLIIQGACIGERTMEGFPILLFQVHNSYVEVFFSPECDEVIASRDFDDLEHLQPYLEHVNITGVI